MLLLLEIFIKQHNYLYNGLTLTSITDRNLPVPSEGGQHVVTSTRLFLRDSGL